MVGDVITSYSGKAYALVRESIENLLSRKYQCLGDTSLFDTLGIEEQTGDIVGTWNPAAESHLIGFEANGVGFTQVDFTRVRFRNPHTYRLFWLLKSYQSLNTIKAWKVEELRMAILNDLTTYPNLADFRRALLDKVCAELGYSYETKKRGKRVLGVIFKALPIQPVEASGEALADKNPKPSHQVPKTKSEPVEAVNRNILADWSGAEAIHVAQGCKVMENRGVTLPQLVKILSWCGGKRSRFDSVIKAQHQAWAEHQGQPKDNLAAAIVGRIKKECPGIF
ncbi:hypothetical protein GCM10011383_38790 [Hymenobacter cavernae]|uniref:Replication initiation protein n=2 Tax=Hymenobacter cavernae TaxID=2044852 RepID=A0ABQ1URK2_9BACT|nr:hypothetical protein GCM10011383_38790 [Hymenobacter cavernae]